MIKLCPGRHVAGSGCPGGSGHFEKWSEPYQYGCQTSWFFKAMSANIFLKTKNALATLWQIPYNPKESGICYRVANAFLVPKNVFAGIVLKNHEV